MLVLEACLVCYIPIILDYIIAGCVKGKYVVYLTSHSVSMYRDVFLAYLQSEVNKQDNEIGSIISVDEIFHSASQHVGIGLHVSLY